MAQVDLLQEEEILQLEALLKKMNPKVGLGWANGLGKQDWASGEKGYNYMYIQYNYGILSPEDYIV